MLTDARRIIADLEAMRARAKSIKQGVEAEISLATSVMVPSEAVVASLRAFRGKFPAVALKLTVGELGMVVDLVLSGKADVRLSGLLLKQDDRITAETLVRPRMAPAASGVPPLWGIARTQSLAG